MKPRPRPPPMNPSTVPVADSPSSPVENMGLQCVYSQGGHGNGIGD